MAERTESLTVKECDNYDAAISLIREYSTIQGAEKCFVSLDKELADLKTYYEGGALLLGYEGDKPIATIALKKTGDSTVEAKRLYIKPEYRGKGYARDMMNAMLKKAKELGFSEVSFTTMPAVMEIGYGLYKRMGFEETDNDGKTAYMRMKL